MFLKALLLSLVLKNVNSSFGKGMLRNHLCTMYYYKTKIHVSSFVG